MVMTFPEIAAELGISVAQVKFDYLNGLAKITAAGQFTAFMELVRATQKRDHKRTKEFANCELIEEIARGV